VGGVQEYVKTLVFFLPCKPNDKYGRVLDGRCEDGVQESEEKGEVNRRGYFSSMIGDVVNLKGKVAVPDITECFCLYNHYVDIVLGSTFATYFGLKCHLWGIILSRTSVFVKQDVFSN
jgi:hypothetical protein